MDLSKLGEMMNAARDMKAGMDARLDAMTFEAESGGGAVVARVSGRRELLKLTIAPAAAAAAGGDVAMLEDLIVAAVNAANRKAADAGETVGREAGRDLLGFDMPGLG